MALVLGSTGHGEGQVVADQRREIQRTLLSRRPHLEPQDDWKSNRTYVRIASQIVRLKVNGNVDCSGVIVGFSHVASAKHCIAGAGTDMREQQDLPRPASLVAYLDDFSLETTVSTAVPLVVDVVGSLGFVTEDVVLLRRRDGEVFPVERHAQVYAGAVPQGDAAVLVSHPLGLPSLMSVRGCRVSALHSETFAHSCEADSGSSGGGLFDLTGAWIGLHTHGGYVGGSVAGSAVIAARIQERSAAIAVRASCQDFLSCASAMLAPPAVASLRPSAVRTAILHQACHVTQILEVCVDYLERLARGIASDADPSSAMERLSLYCQRSVGRACTVLGDLVLLYRSTRGINEDTTRTLDRMPSASVLYDQACTARDGVGCFRRARMEATNSVRYEWYMCAGCKNGTFEACDAAPANCAGSSR